MKKLFTQFKILPVLLLGISGFYEAQQTTIATGSDAQSATGSVAFSVGQPFYESQESAAGKVNTGVQQPYEIFVLVTNENSIQKNINVYPNPVEDFLIVDFNSEKLAKSSYQLFDGTGRMINKGELKNSKTEVNTSTLSSGLYMLSISSEGKTVKTFKIIKNK